MKQLIFIGGIHGVGKTYFCKEISNCYNLEHHSASALIAKEKQEQFSKNKYIENIDQNQDLLVRAINNHVTDCKCILLDGHFCLLNKEGVVTKVPKETFHTLSPLGIIVLKDSIENVLLKLKNRDNSEYDTSLFQSFQDMELEYAQAISYELNVPFFIHDVNDPNPKIYAFIDGILNHLDSKGETTYG